MVPIPIEQGISNALFTSLASDAAFVFSLQIPSETIDSTSPDYPYYYNGVFGDYRGRILNRKLDSLQNIKVEDLMNLQRSNYSIKAEEALPLMLQNLDRTKLSTSQKEFVDILDSWDYNYDPEKAAPILFDNWYNQAAAPTAAGVGPDIRMGQK